MMSEMKMVESNKEMDVLDELVDNVKSLVTKIKGHQPLTRQEEALYDILLREFA